VSDGVATNQIKQSMKLQRWLTAWRIGRRQRWAAAVCGVGGRPQLKHAQRRLPTWRKTDGRKQQT